MTAHQSNDLISLSTRLMARYDRGELCNLCALLHCVQMPPLL
jgi:hypothetical protein